MTSPTILVTGGAGFVGSHACKALAGAGFLPVAYDDLRNGHRDAVKWGVLEQGALEDESRLTEVIHRHRPVAVMHFAAFIEAGESVRHPEAFYRNNVGGTLSLLRAMAATGLSTLVFSSTAAVYGEPETVPIPESHSLRPVNPYGHSKLMVEQIAADVSRANGLNYATLRYFNAAGADPEGEIWERHDPETHLIPLVLQAAFGRRPEIVIFGDDYATPDGTCIRDYIHVSDLAEAHVLCLRHLLDGGPHLSLNLGTGNGASVREVIDTVEAEVGRPVVRLVAARRAGDPAVLVASAEAAHRALGWQPRFPGLAEMVRHAARPFLDAGAEP